MLGYLYINLNIFIQIERMCTDVSKYRKDSPEQLILYFASVVNEQIVYSPLILGQAVSTKLPK